MRRYRLRVRDSFASAHSLRGYEGNCERMHGHNWKVEVEVESCRLDDRGIAVDFRLLKDLLKEVIGKLDHRNLNDVPPFDDMNPSSENIAQFIYGEIKGKLPEGVSLSSVTVWESETASATYSEVE
ncbi:MAG: 6-carboxytetrahydropterin synthase QueD [Deltaproteobacteria bacterium]|nr:MAG: 6-carboxytetrahydropterin synthase QueD [Deltaproteobacteria bacterium]